MGIVELLHHQQSRHLKVLSQIFKYSSAACSLTPVLWVSYRNYINYARTSIIEMMNSIMDILA